MDRDRARRQLAALERAAGTEELAASRWPRRWQALLAILLSARTRDDVTIPVAKRLFAARPSLARVAATELATLEGLIRPVNFHKSKARNVRACAAAIRDEHRGRVPTSFERLVALPGVGRKTANVFLGELGRPAIGVDTHVARIAQKLGWSAQERPERIEADLCALFPPSRWGAVNPTLVRIGRAGREREERLIAEARALP